MFPSGAASGPFSPASAADPVLGRRRPRRRDVRHGSGSRRPSIPVDAGCRRRLSLVSPDLFPLPLSCRRWGFGLAFPAGGIPSADEGEPPGTRRLRPAAVSALSDSIRPVRVSFRPDCSRVPGSVGAVAQTAASLLTGLFHITVSPYITLALACYAEPLYLAGKGRRPS